MPETDDSIGRIVDKAYDALAFDAGGQPDWAAFAAVFDERALLALRVFPEDTAVSLMTLVEYAEAQMRHDLGSQGYSETPGERSTEVIGDVACVRQAFTMNFVDRSVAAVDVFLLLRQADGWRIFSVASDMEQAAPRA